MNICVKMVKKKIITILTSVIFLYLIIEYSGLFLMARELRYETEFVYPIEGDIRNYVDEMEQGEKLSVNPYDNHNINFIIKNEGKCVTSNDDEEGTLPIRVVYLVKSALGNVENRRAIRRTWGYENRFSDVQIRTVFLLGSDNKGQTIVKRENEEFNDIIQGDFIDTYYNNTIKTLMGLRWAAEYCPNSRFYLFVDDDYYVSTRNLLRFLRNPSNYPKYLENPTINFDDVQESNIHNANMKNRRNLKLHGYGNFSSMPFTHRKLKQLVDFDLPNDVELYAGYTFFPKPHRHKFSKWYISLDEYPYDRFPRYVSAGAYVLSNAALRKFYYGSYFVKKFRFDDVYLGIIAKKLNIEPFHSENFWFYRKHPYNVNDFRYAVASHEFSDAKEMEKVWNQQKHAGNS